MVGLVDYGSDSDTDDAPVSQPALAPATQSKSGLFASLPAVKGHSSGDVSSASASAPSKPSLPSKKKKDKGPVKIMLDLPSTKPDEHEEPARKKPKLGSGLGSGLSGLLPAPKKTTAAPASKFKPEVAEPETDPELAGLAALVGKGERTDGNAEDVGGKAEGTSVAAAFTPRAASKAVKTRQEEAVTSSAAPAVDFFSLGMPFLLALLPIDLTLKYRQARHHPRPLSSVPFPPVLLPPQPSPPHPPSPISPNPISTPLYPLPHQTIRTLASTSYLLGSGLPRIRKHGPNGPGSMDGPKQRRPSSKWRHRKALTRTRWPRLKRSSRKSPCHQNSEKHQSQSKRSVFQVCILSKFGS
jgi:hypothetical protein